jgi:hypothetical protein
VVVQSLVHLHVGDAAELFRVLGVNEVRSDVQVLGHLLQNLRKGEKEGRRRRGGSRGVGDKGCVNQRRTANLKDLRKLFLL